MQAILERFGGCSYEENLNLDSGIEEVIHYTPVLDNSCANPTLDTLFLGPKPEYILPQRSLTESTSLTSEPTNPVHQSSAASQRPQDHLSEEGAVGYTEPGQKIPIGRQLLRTLQEQTRDQQAFPEQQSAGRSAQQENIQRGPFRGEQLSKTNSLGTI